MDQFISNLLNAMWFVAIPILVLRAILGLIGKKRDTKHCAGCGYSREGIEDPSACPECGMTGKSVGVHDHIRLQKRYRSRKRVTIDILLIAITSAVSFGIFQVDHFRKDCFYQFMSAVNDNKVDRIESYLYWFPELAQGRFRFDQSITHTGMPLEVACRDNHLAAIKLLLQHGADPNDTNRIPALSHAIKHNNREAVALLLDAGADPERHEMQPLVTALNVAVNAKRSAEIIELLLEHGADPNGSLHKPVPTPLVAATNRSDSAIVTRLLLEAGADPNISSFGSPPLHFAAGRGRHETVRLLLESGADVNLVSPYNETPLDSAIQNLDEGPNANQIIELLKSKGAKTFADIKQSP